MHMRLVAVGDRQPAWVDTAFADYSARLPRAWKFTVRSLALSRLRRRGDAGRAKADECARILADIHEGERVVTLDETGTELTSVELSGRVGDWQADGRDVCFVIGGPDGLDAACRERAEFCWSLSRLTLPHGLARLVCIEQLYRAASLLDGHPYHRG